MPDWDSPYGKWIPTKDKYDYAMKKYDMVSYEKMQQQAEGKKLKEYKLSDEAKAIIQAAKMSKDKKGNVKLSERAISAMVKKGALGKKIPNYMQLPAAYQVRGK